MNKKKYILIAFAALASSVLAYNSKHGPFPDDAEVSRIKLSELSCEPDAKSATNGIPRYIFQAPGPKGIRLSFVRKSEAWFAELIVKGKTVMQPCAFSNYGTVGGMMAYSADLNQDGADDFVIYSYSGGCGLACGHCNVAFILSSGKDYTLTTVTTLFPDKSDFILLNGKPYFIHTSFLGVAECKDGKGHNFWIYNLLAFGKNGVQVDNGVRADFPKPIWYTFKPNHTETTIITNEQKVTLQRQSLTCIYWKKDS
jgi:hypothetical protein